MRLSIDRGSDVWWEACRLEPRERWMRKRETVETAIIVATMISIVVGYELYKMAINIGVICYRNGFRMQA